LTILRPHTYYSARDSSAERFIIDGLLHRHATAIVGRPKAGKSTLAGAMVAAVARGNGEFLGRPVKAPSGPVAAIVTDPGDDEAWSARLAALDVPDGSVFVGPYEGYRQTFWDDLIVEIRSAGVGLFVFDNASGAAGDDVRSNATARLLLDPMSRIHALGVPVVLVAHTAKTPFEGSGAGFSRSPMGSTAYEAWARHLVAVESTGPGTVLVATWGNHAPSAELTASVNVDGDRVSYTLMTEKVRVDRRPRAAETHGRRLDLAELVRHHGWDGLPNAEIGRRLAGEYPDRWPSPDAARVAYSRAKGAAGA